ncbi:MAG: sugar phosphate isomerase/epimerase [Oscillospiraceae bacterium]|nr:sugar phosphate isomerase/epimerase [Oscillospiraceae bacterium]
MSKELMKTMQNGIWYQANGGDENPEKAFGFIRDCGFDAVDFDFSPHIPNAEVRIGNVHGFYDADIETLLDYYRPIKAAADKVGIAFAQAHGPYPMSVEGHPEAHEYLLTVVEKMLAICQMMECPILVVHPMIIRNRQQEFQLNMEMYRKLMPAARRYGVMICLENMHGPQNGHKVSRACSNMDDVCRYIDTLNGEAGETLFGFCYDVGHGNLTSNDIYEDIKQLGHRLTALHIHDNDGLKDLHMIPYICRLTKKDLNTDWEGFLQALKEIGYRGALNLESAGSLTCLPQELFEPLLKYAAAVCGYFQKKILE